MALRSAGADDQVAFPVAGHRAVGGLSGPLADHDHVRDAAAALILAAFGAPDGPAGAQAGSQVTAQRAAALDVDRLVDRLVRHPHLRPAGELCSQAGRDLLR
jgi:hypothetical protein